MKDGPLERVETLGFRSATPIDLLAIVRAQRAEDVSDQIEAARYWLSKRRIEHLSNLSNHDISELSGDDGFEATKIRAWLELGRRAGNANTGEFAIYDNADSVFQHLKTLVDPRQEQFWVVLLNSKLGVLATREIHRGTANRSIVGAREVFGEALRWGAVSIVVAHNHPSGDPSPSPEDIEVTRKLAEIGKSLDIEVLDHIIVGHHDYRSLRQMGVFG